MLLGLKEGVKVPEGALHEVVGRHLGEAHLQKDLPVLGPDLYEGNKWLDKKFLEESNFFGKKVNQIFSQDSTKKVKLEINYSPRVK